MSQDQALQSSENNRDKNIIPFVVEYNPSLPKIGLIINKYWDLLQLSQKDSVKNVHAYKPILAFKRPRNLRDFLVHSSFNDTLSHFSQSCNRRRSHIVKILLKVMFLQAAVPRTRSIFDFQQIVRPRMLYILLNVNAVICNTSVKLINKFLNV